MMARNMFKFYNNNPKELFSNDSYFRALALFFDTTWDDIAKMSFDYYLEHGVYLDSFDLSEQKPYLISYMENRGYKNIIPALFPDIFCTDPQEITTLYPETQKGKYIFIDDRYAVTMIDGIIYDVENTSMFCFDYCYKSQ